MDVLRVMSVKQTKYFKAIAKCSVLDTAYKICLCECQNGHDCTKMCKKPLDKALKMDKCVNLANASFDQTNEECKKEGLEMQKPLITFGKYKPIPEGETKEPETSRNGEATTEAGNDKSEKEKISDDGDEGGTGTTDWRCPTNANIVIVAVMSMVGFVFA